MSGLVKGKNYDWKDSNLALFGSDTEKQVKKESAESEPAWEGCGQSEGLKIWRIVKFEVQDWPESDHGNFYTGDSYIVLHTYKADPDSEKLDYDLHFWIGKNSSQDEYGTAAYKTVELDTFLDDAAIQHREVQGNESQLFKSYFKQITYMKGGAETGFRHVTPREYKTRLFLVSGKGMNPPIKEISLKRDNVVSEDVYVMDNGLTLYQWNGSASSPGERIKAAQFVQQLESERGSAKTEVLDEADAPEGHDFYTLLVDEDDEEADPEQDLETGVKLFKVSDASGSLEFSNVKEGAVELADLDTNEVFIFDIGKLCFVWVGAAASESEKKNGLSYAHRHLQSSSHPLIPIEVVKEGQRYSKQFNTAIAA